MIGYSSLRQFYCRGRCSGHFFVVPHVRVYSKHSAPNTACHLLKHIQQPFDNRGRSKRKPPHVSTILQQTIISATKKTRSRRQEKSPAHSLKLSITSTIDSCEPRYFRRTNRAKPPWKEKQQFAWTERFTPNQAIPSNK